MRFKNFNVIDKNSLPMRSPLHLSIIAWLLLDRQNAPSWIFSIVGVMLGICWLAYFFCLVFVTRKDVPGFGRKSNDGQ